MQHKLRNIKLLYSILSISTIILGILMIVIQPENRKYILYVSGITFIVYGIIKIISYFSKDLLKLAYQYDLALGVIAVIIGLLILFWKKDYTSTIVRLISIFLIFDSLLKIQTSIESKKIGIKAWIPVLIMSVLGVAGGICIFTQSYNVSTMALIFIGICLITYGITNFIVVTNTAIIKNKNQKEN